MASPISGISSLGASSASSASSAASSAAPTEQVFLQLLVSQIQNQDPLNPTDSTQFVSQLAQFSELEQTLAMRGDLDTIAGAVSTPSQQSSTGADPSNNSTGTTPTTHPSAQIN